MSESQGEAEGGTVEDRSEIQDERDLARLWLEQLALAHREEESWRDKAQSVLDVYRSQKSEPGLKAPYKKSIFNILYSNTEILVPAVFNSEPVPDVRERWSDGDPVAKEASQILTRALSYTIEDGQMGEAATGVTFDMLLQGRGVARVDFQPPSETGPETITYRLVQWDDFRRGPGKAWSDVTWVAFRHYLTREEVAQVNPQAAEEIDLESELAGIDKVERREGTPVPEVFKRAEVWEVWDKDTRQVLYMAKSWPDAPLKVLEDPFGLKDFFPVPQPAYAVRSTNSLIPVELYSYYNELANELDTITRRLRALTAALKWRGFYADPNAGDFLEKLEGLRDGQIAPISNAMQALQQGGGDLSKSFFFMPLKECAEVLIQLVQQRESVKQTIYEITGVSDVLRGASNAEETATAQQIKANWGSLRISKMQGEIARVCRDLMRLAAEIMAEHFSPETLMSMTGVQPQNPQVFDLLKNDTMRRFRIDVETDSTIRADLQRQQQNIGQFVTGLGSFFQSIGPAVQTGMFPIPLAAEMLSAFSRPFRLGKGVEEMLDRLPEMVAQQQAQQQAMPQADPNAQHQAELQQDMEKHKLTLQHQAQVEQMKAQAAAPPEMQMLQQAVQAIVQGVQQMAQVSAASAQSGQQQAQAMMQSADAMTAAAQAALQPKAMQRDASGAATAMVPAGGAV